MRYFLLLLVLLGCDPSKTNPAVTEGDAAFAQDGSVGDAHLPPEDGALSDASDLPLDATEVDGQLDGHLLDTTVSPFDEGTSAQDVLSPSDDAGQDAGGVGDADVMTSDTDILPDATPPVLDAVVVEPDAAPPPPPTCTVNEPNLLCGAGCYNEQGQIVCLWTELVVDDRCYHDYDGDGLDPAQGDCDDANPDNVWCWDQPLPPNCTETDFVVEL